MAKKQYMLVGDGNWQSMFGRALIAITNTSSTRKLVLRALDVNVRTMMGSSNALVAKAVLYKGVSISGGEDMGARVGKYDSTATLPSTVKVYRDGMINTYNNRVRSVTAAKFGFTVGTQNTLNCHTSVGRFRGIYTTARRGSESIVEPLFVRQNEAYSLVCDTVNSSSCLRVDVNVTVNGKTFIWTFINHTQPGISMFAISNTGTDVVRIQSISLQEVGTPDTPYIRLVPIGQIYSSDINDPTAQNVQVIPMDSAYGALSTSTCKVYTDVGLIPLGVPESYINQGSTGSPKGFNYLHTKDFDGPTLKVFFPEMAGILGAPGAAGVDMLGHSYSHKRADIGVRHTDITINPGEGLALVSSAETAVGTQAAFSGWTSLMFSAIISDESLYTPVVSITNVIAGSQLKVVRVSDSTVLLNVNVPGTSYNYNIDEAEIGQNIRIEVRKASSAPYYKPWFTLSTVSTVGVSVTALQESDE